MMNSTEELLCREKLLLAWYFTALASTFPAVFRLMMNSTEELLRRDKLLLPVVDLSSGYSIRGNLFIVLARGVEHLELPGLVVAHVVSKVPGLHPVDIGGLCGKPRDVGPNEDHAANHNDRQGLESNVVPQGGEVHSLHFTDLVVWHSSTLAHQHGVVGSLQHLGQKHLEYLLRSVIKLESL